MPLQGQQGLEIKNTPLLFQQELNTYYKDILNCEIIHPHYWDGIVPETFFLKKRKGIDAYKDWGGDEVIDYINFDGEEYAIVKQDSNTTPKIAVKKWLKDVSVGTIANLVATGRTVNPTWGEFDEIGILGEINTVSAQYDEGGNYLYVFSQAEYTLRGTKTNELFITKYKLAVAFDINPDAIDEGHTYRVKALSGLSNLGSIVPEISSDGKNLYAYSENLQKFVQVQFDKPWDLTTLSSRYKESAETLEVPLLNVKGICLSHNGDKIFFVNETQNIGCLEFAYGDITKNNKLTQKYFSTGVNYVGIAINKTGDDIYATNGGYMYRLHGTANWDIDSFEITTDKKLIDSAQDSKGAQKVFVSGNGEHYLVVQKDLFVMSAGFSHYKTLITQTYVEGINHSFKRNFNSVKGKILYGDGTSTKITGSSESEIHKLTPTTSVTWTANAFAGAYIYIVGGATSAATTTGVGGGQIMQIKSNTAEYLTVDGWDIKPNQSTYIIYDNYGEVLSFIGSDGLYHIHNDDKVLRAQALNMTSNPVIDADWSNGRVFALLKNGTVACSAVRSSDNEQAMAGGYYSDFFNGTSYIGNAVGAMRVIAFNDVVILFSNTGIYVIKKESFSMTNGQGNQIVSDAFVMNLAFDFVGLHQPRAVCLYNTGLYFISNKKEFLSLNIEESYYNKYKITTEDLGIDIQQWLDNIEDDDKLSVGIDTSTIYITWEHKKNSITGKRIHDKSTVFQYDTFYSFRHRRETDLIITNARIDNDQTYMGPITYRYGLKKDNKLDDWDKKYTQHLRRFNGDADIFSLKTILYHKLYLGANTSADTHVIYKARLSDGIYQYDVPLNSVMFLQKSENLSNDALLGKSILGFSPLGGSAEELIVGSYLADVDVLEIPLGLTYSLMEFIVEGDFETGGNLIGGYVHDNHLTPYEDVVPYLHDD